MHSIETIEAVHFLMFTIPSTRFFHTSVGTTFPITIQEKSNEYNDTRR
jgi:hypothetical protein